MSGCRLTGQPRAAIVSFLSTINRYARRKFVLAPLDAYRTTTDELTLVGLIAAAQAGHEAELDARCCWVVTADGRTHTIWQVRHLAAFLTVEGHILSVPSPTSAPVRPPLLQLVPGTVHTDQVADCGSRKAEVSTPLPSRQAN